MSDASVPRAIAEGHRVASTTRPEFPKGTVLRILDQGYVLVRWDGDVLETAHHRDLMRIDADQ
ncbi:hypothetical protein HNQ60_000674 [Povalibacter uvarum]|uniref:Uncharacterized protein n=1 Tax=Povalibacter uvarum TaxID=732238 RepID=A0A841HHT5_9GAMM|nr:hypothetical protein [Povalibacter uvarum]MBB6091828.1 hypothetical protein [Povalibacter uvarum]